MSHFGARKTAAQRAAIDARAAAWQRPITPTQRSALRAMLGGPLLVTNAGWQRVEAFDIATFHTQTLEALEKRGLVEFERRGGLRRRYAAKLTRKGRLEARRG